MSFILSENDNTGNGNSTGSNATASTTLKFITKAQAASILKVSTATINNWVKLGKLSLGDNKKLISRESFEKITLQINAIKKHFMATSLIKPTLVIKRIFRH